MTEQPEPMPRPTAGAVAARASARPAGRTRRRLLPAAVLLSGLVITGCAGFDTWQRQAIFGTGQDQTRWYRDAPPGTEQYDLTLANGDRVHTWYLASDRPDSPTVLYLHGTRWNLHNSVFRFDRLHGLGANVLAIDYRGFGRSTHRLPSEDSAMQDVRVALTELARRQPDPSRRFVYGHSLGGALAIQAAASAVPGLAGLIVESTFTSIADIVTGSRWGWIPGMTWLISQRFDSATRIASVRIPVLFIHGTADSIVPSGMSEKLYKAASAVPAGFKELLLIDGGSHSGASRADPATYNRAMRGFMQRAGDLTAARTTAAPLAGRPVERPASLAANPEPSQLD